MVSGPPKEPNYPVGTSIGASLRALHDGITLFQPVGGEFTRVLTRGWLVVVSADQPAAALLTGTMVGTTAQRFCRQCLVDRRIKGFDSPCSFIAPTDSSPTLRTQADRTNDMEICGDCDVKMNSAGWKSWSNAFTRCGPHFDFLMCVPEDLMHVEYEGLVKGELAHFIFYCIRIKEYFELDDLNEELDWYSWPDGSRPVPYFTDSFLTGDPGKKADVKQSKKQKREPKARGRQDAKYVPKSGAHIAMTAGQTITFSLHSPQFFRNLNVPEDDAAFACWRDHLQYLQLLMHHSLTKDDVLEVERLITKHQEGLAALASIYPNIWKPKHHYALHFPLNVLQFGPPRHYWCMRFEAMNQVFKKIAVGGSYRDTTRGLAQFWTMRSALARQKENSWEDWATTYAVSATDKETFDVVNVPPHVQETLETWPTAFGDSISTTYISELCHDGHNIIAGSSWLLLKLDTQSEPVLACVMPFVGIFTVDAGYFLQVGVYTSITISEPKPQRTVQIPDSLEPCAAIISLDEILEMVVLWPSKCEKTDLGNKWTFVEV